MPATSYIQELKAAMNSTTHTLEYLQQELMKERQAHVETQRSLSSDSSVLLRRAKLISQAERGAFQSPSGEISQRKW